MFRIKLIKNTLSVILICITLCFTPAVATAGGVIVAAVAWVAANTATIAISLFVADETVNLGRRSGWWDWDLTPEGGGGAYPVETTLDKLRIEVTANKSEDKASINIRVKDASSGRYVDTLPSGYTLWAAHSNDKLSLIEGDASSVASSGSSGFVNIGNIPTTAISGFPTIINYSLQGQSQFVKLEILDSSGSIVYTLSESSPNPASPIPFIWKGKNMNGNNVPSGSYSIKLKAIKNNGSTEFSPIGIMNIGEEIIAGIEKQITYYGSIAYLTLFAPLAGDEANDTVVVKLKDPSGNEVLTARGSVNINFAGDTGTPTITLNPLNYSTNMYKKVDGVPIEIITPSANEANPMVRVTVFRGDSSNEIKYEYNIQTKIIKMIGSFGAKTYSPNSDKSNERDVYYNILSIMDNLIGEAYKQEGLRYDPSTKNLEIDRKYINGVDSGCTVTASTAGDIIKITIAKGSESIICDYDLASNTFSTLGEISFASNYSWDLIAGTPIASAGGPITATGVRATGLSEDFKGKIDELLSFIGSMLMIKGDLYGQMGALMTVRQKDKTPIPRPTEPTIDDISWVGGSGSGIIRVEGSADMRNYSPKLLINGNEYSVSRTSDNTWTFTNYGAPLRDGENKVNAIVKFNHRIALESGDATVYLGSGGNPDLILVNPRDREIFESTIFPFRKTDFRIKGKTSPGATISAFGESVVVDSAGNFDRDFSAPDLQEGVKTISITVAGSGSLSISKAVVGAYKFSPNNKSQAYVLRRGDFLFNEKAKFGSDVDNPFDWIPYDPNHSGIYTGGGDVTEAIDIGVTKRSISFWNNDGFTGATQAPTLVDEATRIQVSNLIAQQVKDPPIPYDFPIGFTFSSSPSSLNPVKFKLTGHYNGPTGGFYCGELAYWGWEQILGKNNFGVRKEEVMYPFEGIENDNYNSILPAYLYAKSIEVRKVNK